MALRDKFDRTFIVNTSLPKAVIVNTFKERIEESSKDSWLTIKDINYKKIQVDDYRAVIKQDPFFFGQIGGIGVAILHFETSSSFTEIKAVVKPFVNGIWFLIGFLVLFSAVCIWFTPGIGKFLFVALAWIMFLTPVYISFAIRRYRLTNYLKAVLIDIGVQEDLVKA
ncbi:hypothetical protein SAMN05216490_0739 [Mucilaginibacter mallensis]|uniref:Uncharacterized protein n=1 Tax=Mucilaginibacter mallensis TaxID=652787 RepID=A0A1H1QDH1_MUCMA|nr:hypothetical protein [Mucilaginibacter mallensis]SDS20919.1 hypothetical protein SAMN05216490_0739 [Mucilaginibacter mallensis]